MEEALVAAQNGRIRLTPGDIDVLLEGSDILATLAEIRDAEVAGWGTGNASLANLIDRLEGIASGKSAPVIVKASETRGALIPVIAFAPSA